MERIENDRIAKRDYVEDSTGSHSVARRMVHDRNEWLGL